MFMITAGFPSFLTYLCIVFSSGQGAFLWCSSPAVPHWVSSPNSLAHESKQPEHGGYYFGSSVKAQMQGVRFVWFQRMAGPFPRPALTFCI